MKITQHMLHLSMYIFLLIYSDTMNAETFFTDFEESSVPDQTDPGLTTTITNNALSADFTGGTIDEIGVTQLYLSGRRSWMLGPNGETIVGATAPGDGNGSIVLSSDAACIIFFIRNEISTTTATTDIIAADNTTVLLSESTFTDSGWAEVAFTQTVGGPLIGKVNITNNGSVGSGMVVLEDLTYSTETDGCTPANNTTNNPNSDTASTDLGPNPDNSKTGSADWLLLLLSIPIIFRTYFTAYNEPSTLLK